MSLRDDLIEAGARKLAARQFPRLKFEGLLPEIQADWIDRHRDEAAAVLDAMLDKLDEHADEWNAAVGSLGYTSNLVAALRMKP